MILATEIVAAQNRIKDLERLRIWAIIAERPGALIETMDFKHQGETIEAPCDVRFQDAIAQAVEKFARDEAAGIAAALGIPNPLNPPEEKASDHD